MAAPASSSLSVVIVNFRTPDLVIRCVRSILAFGIAAARDIVIVENASGDNSAERLSAALPECTLVVATDNAGYGAGLNLGFAQAEQSLVLCLNPDTYFEDARVLELGAIFAAEQRLALVGLDLHYPDGSRQLSARRDYSYFDILLRRSPLGNTRLARRFNDRHLMADAWGGGLFPADWVIGTGFVVRADAYRAIGGMDEEYFLYMEDVDLCVRLRKQGWTVAAMPEVRLVHDHQRASAGGPLSWAGKQHLRSLNTFRRKHRIPLLPARN